MHTFLKLLVLNLLVGMVLLSSCAWAGREPHDALYRINVDGTAQTRMLAHSDDAYWGPAWSPDGTKVVLTRLQPGNLQRELYLMHADGTNLIQLTHNGRNNYFPAWAPDNHTITFLSQQGDHVDTADIYGMTVDGRHEMRLTENSTQEYGASWSPDGRVIVFGSKRAGSWQIYTMQADGSQQVVLSTSAEGNAPVWSPDGSTIAFTSDRDGDDDIYLMNPDGSNQRNLTQNTAWDDQPAWSPDGTRLAFASDRTGRASIYTMNVASAMVERITTDETLVAGFPSWSNDSQHLIFHAHEEAFALHTMLSRNINLVGGITVGVFMLFLVLLHRHHRHRSTPERGHMSTSSQRAHGRYTVCPADCTTSTCSLCGWDEAQHHRERLIIHLVIAYAEVYASSLDCAGYTTHSRTLSWSRPVPCIYGAGVQYAHVG